MYTSLFQSTVRNHLQSIFIVVYFLNDSLDDWKIAELNQYCVFFERWSQMTTDLKLTSPTSFACIQICKVFIEMSKFLIDERGFKYVILGQISSDPIEKTFGKYRQMSGGNYYISERQVLCYEKKLNIISLV